MKAHGLFLCHTVSTRMLLHYERLVHQSGHLIEWHFVYNPGNKAMPGVGFPYRPAAELLPRRFRAFHDHGGVQGGYMDMVIMPCVLALDCDHVWALEYDVDYSGDWGELFAELGQIDGDLLTTHVSHRCRQSDWYHWRTAHPPAHVADEHLCSSFNPLMRLSRRFAETYLDFVGEDDWSGHYEFVLATMALASGSRVVDIGADGEFTPDALRGRIYERDTFRWRPSRQGYFHENPQRYAPTPGLLHHPVKPNMTDWNGPGSKQG